MKRLLILTIVFISLISITGCKSKFTYDDMNKVNYETILDMKGSYIVIAYQANCANCEKLKGTIYDYIKYVEKNPTAMPIYAINVNTGVNKKMLLLKDDSYPKNMVGTTNYKNIKVKATPSIMVIKDKTLVKVISDYNTLTPVTDGKAYFKELMK